jgi:hypothetical protein
LYDKRMTTPTPIPLISLSNGAVLEVDPNVSRYLVPIASNTP